MAARCDFGLGLAVDFTVGHAPDCLAVRYGANLAPPPAAAAHRTSLSEGVKSEAVRSDSSARELGSSQKGIPPGSEAFKSGWLLKPLGMQRFK